MHPATLRRGFFEFRKRSAKNLSLRGRAQQPGGLPGALDLTGLTDHPPRSPDTNTHGDKIAKYAQISVSYALELGSKCARLPVVCEHA